MRVLFDDRPASSCATGIGRYASTMGAILAQTPPAAYCHLASQPPFARAFASTEEEELLLPTLLEREGVDVFHSSLFHLPAVLPTRTKAVVTIHDAIPASRPDLTTPGFQELFERRAAAAARRADLVVCPSQHARHEVGRALGIQEEKIRVIPEAPASAFFPPAEEPVREACHARGLEPGGYVLFVGSLERRKGPDLLLEAMAGLRERLPALKAAFVGSAVPGFDLAGEISARGLERSATWVGRADDEELILLLGGALALVLPSRHEGFGLPVLEAFACGTPVIAAQATSLPEVCGDAAILCAPEDPAALADAVRTLSEDSDLRRSLQARGLERLAQRFSTEHVRLALEALYRELDPMGAQP